jgi:hypothetical protein
MNTAKWPALGMVTNALLGALIESTSSAARRRW